MQKLELKTVLDQLGVLSGLPGYPKGDAAMQSLAHAGAEFSDYDALRRFVMDWLRSERKAPYPADLYEAARLNKPKRLPQRSFACTVCYDTGKTAADFLIVWDKHGAVIGGERLTSEQVEGWSRGPSLDRDGTAKPHSYPRLLELGKHMIYSLPVDCECRRNAP